MTPGNAVLERHRQYGGLCYEIIDDQLTETEGSQRRDLLAVTELPGSFGGRARHLLANALAAVAACRAAGVSAKDIRRALTTFTPDDANPGRATLYRAGDSPVVVDYGHNAAALEATGRFVLEVWGRSPVAVVTLPGDRRDDLLAQTAAAIADCFGTVVLYEDSDKRGREPGEMTALIGAALRQARPAIHCEAAENPADALRAGLALADGAPVLFLYEKLGLARDALQAVGAQPWPEASSAGTASPWPASARRDVAARPPAAPAAIPAPVPASRAGGPLPATAAVPLRAAPSAAALSRTMADASADYGVVCGCEPAGPDPDVAQA
jgi:cyanophycin synthetase